MLRLERLAMSIAKTPDGNGGPYRFHYAERPSAREEPVEAGEDATPGEGQDEEGVPMLEGIHHHHEREGGYSECREHSCSLPRCAAQIRAVRPGDLLSARIGAHRGRGDDRRARPSGTCKASRW